MTDRDRINPMYSALFTDLYQLTMGAAYHAEGMDGTAVFELFFRRMPDTRNFIVAAGLEDVLDCLGDFSFTEDDLAYLADQGLFSDHFLEVLRDLRFTGDVDAVPEGTPVFPNEPLIRVTAPIMEAQLVETLVLNQIHFQSVAASKAARVVRAAAGRTVVDFGSRRAHGADAAVKAARASYLAGAAGTSNVVAGMRYGIPIYGTMAHSYVQAHGDELEAMRAFARVHPATTLLVDTYDTLEGVRKVIELCRGEPSVRVRAIRLDSGDLGDLARQARGMLDDHGLQDLEIFASSGLDEYAIRDLLAAEAPIDGFGVGTSMVVSDDAPSLDMAYKLVEYDGTPRTKLSTGKAMHAGAKQVFRVVEDGVAAYDVIGRAGEDLAGRSLLEPVMRNGERLAAGRSELERSRRVTVRALDELAARLHRFDDSADAYVVKVSDALGRLLQEVTDCLESSQVNGR